MSDLSFELHSLDLVLPSLCLGLFLHHIESLLQVFDGLLSLIINLVRGNQEKSLLELAHLFVKSMLFLGVRGAFSNKVS